MLVKLTPDQAAHYWDIIADSIEEALPPMDYGSPKKMQHILMQLMLDRMQAWVITTDARVNGESILGLIVSRIIDGGVTGVNNLELYTITAFKHIPSELWEDGFKTLEKYARTKNCYRVVAYSDNKRVLDMADRLGWSSEYTFLTKEVEYNEDV